MTLDKTPVMPELDKKARRAIVPQLAIVSSPAGTSRTPFVTELAIGRGQHNTLVVDDGLLSRNHLRIARSGDDAFTIEDLASTNGTYVDGVRLAGAVKAALGSVLRFGHTVAVICEQPSSLVRSERFVGSSAAMAHLLRDVALVAKTDAFVLIIGETGTGKEAVAAEIHAQSGRAGALVAVNCGAVPEQLAESHFFGHRKGAFTGAEHAANGAFRAADRGTLFLDEVGELPLTLQPKLLRALDTQKIVPLGEAQAQAIDARIVAATNVELLRAVEQDKFRRDLYARLAGYVIRTPPLRARREDILLIAHHFFKEGKTVPTLSASLVERLLLHPWPMNVRELKNVVQGWRIRGADELGIDDFETEESEIDASRAAPQSKAELLSVLRQYDGVIAKVAKHYGKHRRQVYRWLEAFGIDGYR